VLAQSPRTIVCVQVYVCACNCFVWYSLLIQGIVYQLSPLTLHVTVNSRNVTHAILSLSVPETVSIREINLRIVVEDAWARTGHRYIVAGECVSRTPGHCRSNEYFTYLLTNLPTFLLAYLLFYICLQAKIESHDEQFHF